MALHTLAIVFRLAIRNVIRNRRRSLLTLLAVSVGIWSSVALAAWARGIADQMARDAIQNFTAHIQIHSPLYLDDPVVQHRFEVPEEALQSFLNSSDVIAASVRVKVPAVIRSEREVFGVTLIGIDPSVEKEVSFIGEAVHEGHYLDGLDDAGVLVGRKLVDLLQTKLNRRVVLMTEGADREIADRGFKIKGIFDAELESTEKAYVITGIKTLQTLLGINADVSEIAVLAHDRDEVPKLTENLRTLLPDLDVRSWNELEPLIDSMMKMQGGILLLWFAIVVITVSFGLINTIFMAIFERTHELGIMQALGMRPLYILVQILIESAILIATGMLIGNSIGAATIAYFGDGINMAGFASATEFMGMPNIVYPSAHTKDWVALNIMILSIGLLGSIYPAWKASRIEPTEAITRYH